MSRHQAHWVPDTEPSGYHGRHRSQAGPDDWEAYWFCRNCHETWWGLVPDDQLCQDCRAEEDFQ